ncbi:MULTISPECIES: hypothetical protein [Parachlamydia]|uniref:hypothetical protein n=1 Tax=Parachlamydia TaxID=83551 RepID=UPI0001C17B2C|nr:hypothetical protein [Parachlamydia acanthamoebae]EFB42742.1 hypothetical protein pah_c003o023 [Parachlamydia acanthamoebae str. Hall's coccus]
MGGVNSIYNSYKSGDYFKYPERKQLLKGLMSDPNREVSFESNFDQLDPRIKSFRKKIAVACSKVKHKLKLKINRGYRKKFLTTISKIDKAYSQAKPSLADKTSKPLNPNDEHLSKPSQSSSEHVQTPPKPMPAPAIPVDPFKEKRLQLQNELDQLNRVQIDLDLKIEQKKQEKKAIVDEYSVSNQLTGSEIEQKESELKKWQVELARVETILKIANEIKANPKSFYVLWDSDEEKAILKLDPKFDLKKLDHEIKIRTEYLSDILKTIEELTFVIKSIKALIEEQESKQKEFEQLDHQLISLENEASKNQKAMVLLKSQMTEIENGGVFSLENSSEFVEERVDLFVEEETVVYQEENILFENEAVIGKIQDSYAYRSGEENLKVAIGVIKNFVDGLNGSEKQKATSLRRQLGFFSKTVKTDKLEMSGMTDVELVRQKYATLILLLSKALENPANSSKVRDVTNQFLDRLILEDASKDGHQQLINFLFEHDSHTGELCMDEMTRLLLLSNVLGAVVIMTQYFWDKDNLRKDMKIVKRAEETSGLFKRGAIIAANKLLEYLKGNIVSSVLCLPALQGNEDCEKHVLSMVEALQPSIIQILIHDSKNSLLKRKVAFATEKFGNNDLKKLMDFIDFEKLPTTTETTMRFVEMFESFIENMDKIQE